jgi:asparagine synthase (glutamine-hydrolysing)
MCGIAAIFSYDSNAPRVDEGELTAIRDHMTARGPDGAGNWFDEKRRVGLGHRRLSIIDLSPSGAQPMLWPERKLAITYNGEIYNYRELRSDLEKKGHTFKSTSDTEVLLHLYAEHGDAMAAKLRGMFAFALWDGSRNGLLLARDPFGIKPLYLADDGKTLRAASQVKALLAGGRISTTPDMWVSFCGDTFPSRSRSTAKSARCRRARRFGSARMAGESKRVFARSQERYARRNNLQLATFNLQHPSAIPSRTISSRTCRWACFSRRVWIPPRLPRWRRSRAARCGRSRWASRNSAGRRTTKRRSPNSSPGDTARSIRRSGLAVRIFRVVWKNFLPPWISPARMA